MTDSFPVKERLQYSDRTDQAKATFNNHFLVLDLYLDTTVRSVHLTLTGTMGSLEAGLLVKDAELVDGTLHLSGGAPTMSAIVFNKLGEVALVQRPKPKIQSPGDALVKVTHASICGTDLHILQGHVPSCQPGRILGHEGVGIIESLGAGVTTLTVGMKVLIACISSCGVCTRCRGNLSAHCTTGGWILGNTIDGTQAEYVRVPHAACSLYPLPDAVTPEGALPLSDSVPTAYDVGLLPGNIKPGAKVAIIGAGPVALALVMLAKLYSPKCIVVIGRGESRLETAKKLGADHVFSTLHGDDVAVQKALEVSGGGGFDLVSECVGAPSTFNICQRLLSIGGTLTNAGVHGCQVTFDIHQLWDKNISES